MKSIVSDAVSAIERVTARQPGCDDLLLTSLDCYSTDVRNEMDEISVLQESAKKRPGHAHRPRSKQDGRVQS
jgi:hypothetical protein